MSSFIIALERSHKLCFVFVELSIAYLHNLIISAMYYGVSICLVSFASAMAVVTLNVHFRGLRGAPVPQSVKKIFLSGLARLVFMQFSPSFVMAEKCSVADNSDSFEQRMRVC